MLRAEATFPSREDTEAAFGRQTLLAPRGTATAGFRRTATEKETGQNCNGGKGGLANFYHYTVRLPSRQVVFT